VAAEESGGRGYVILPKRVVPAQPDLGTSLYLIWAFPLFCFPPELTDDGDCEAAAMNFRDSLLLHAL